MISRLCKEHSTLSKGDIAIIEDIARHIHITADLIGADIFIDCLTKQANTALVLAQARPSSTESLYKESVVGEFAHGHNEPAVLRTLHIGIPSTDMLATTQESRHVRQNVSAIRNERNEVIACLIAESDVTGDLKAKRNLSLLSETTEQLTETLLSKENSAVHIPQYMNEGIVIFDTQGMALYVNPVAEQIYKKLGYMNALVGLSFANMALEDIEFSDIIENKTKNFSEVRFGTMELVLKYVTVENRLPNQACLILLIEDETDVKAKEKELSIKSIAIKEIHHRVKNNLQMVASLLNLQSRRIDDAQAKEAFNRSISRVLSIASTHDILAQDGLDELDLTQMLKKVSSDIVCYSQARDKNITLYFKGDSIQTNSSIATSIALVVCEILQNCFKHAFIGRDKGNIHIETRRGNNFSHISIRDDGIGFDESKQSNHLGNTIIQQIIHEKLRGKYTLQSSPQGTTVFFDFSMENEGYQESIY